MEQVILDFYLNYKQLKNEKSNWFYGPNCTSADRSTTWRLQVDKSHPDKLGVYVTLINGAPCTLHSYRIFILSNEQPSQVVFLNRCTLPRTFPCNHFSWGFENFCTRRELRAERRSLYDRKTKVIHLRCLLMLETASINALNQDHSWATDLFPTRSLTEWIEFLQTRNDLPELNNRVNQEIESRS
jgi:hypothetical protein